MVTIAQLSQDFSANQFPNNPEWRGHLHAYSVNIDQILQSQTINNTYISTANELALGVVWEFGIKLAFNPSPSNQLRVYLVADRDTLIHPLEGYFIQIGENGNTDRYQLFRQNGEETTMVMTSGPITRNDAAQVNDRVRVLRDSNGNWELFAAIDEADAFTSLATGSDLSLNTTAFFGISSRFTASNSDKFFFEYFSIDTTSQLVNIFVAPPSVNQVTLVDSQTIQLTFDKSLDTETAEAVSNYSLNHDYGNPSSAVLDNSIVTLIFDSIFTDNHYELTINNIWSLDGGIIAESTVVGFSYESPVVPAGKLLPDDSSEAVFYDDFSNGALASWSGTDNVYLGMERLKVADSATSPTIITVDNDRLRNTVWEAGIDIEGPVTTGNFVRLYLAANTHPSDAHQGYHLQIDGSGGNHVYRIYRQNGGTRSQIFQSAPIANVGGKFRARVRVICDIDGTWSVFADEYDSGTFTQNVRANGELTASDTQYEASVYAGYFVTFTTTRRSDFKLDYLLIKQYEDMIILPDAPTVLEVEVVDSQAIQLTFDKPLDTETAELVSNYSLNHDYGNPSSAVLDNSIVTLIFDSIFTDNHYELTINNIWSLDGGIIAESTVVGFSYESPVVPAGKLLPDDSSEAVFYDDFSNGALASWSGTDNVYLGMERLKVADSATSPTIITVDNDRLRNTVWEAGIDIEGPVTTGNFVRLYLAANTHPSDAHQGYHLQIDGSGGNHVYRIYRQNGGTRSQIFQSAPIANVGGKFRARVRVICDIDGTWSVFADEYDSGTFTQIARSNGELTISDTQYDASTYAGYFVNFSTTRRSDFKLDYLLIKQYEDMIILPDAPTVLEVEVVDSQTIQLTFDKPLDTETAELVSNYSLNHDYGNPSSAVLDNSIVTLIFDSIFTDNHYELTINNIWSLDGGIIAESTVVGFSYESPVVPAGKLLPDDSSEAVFYDDFSNGTLAGWSGAEYIHLENERLKVSDSATSPMMVTIENERLRNTVWEAGFDIEGPVTGGNYVRLYLAASEHPAVSHQGYHLQIDGSGGNHVYRLYRQNGGTRSQIFQSAPIANVGGKFRARVRVICDIDGIWSVFADEYDSGTFTQIARSNGELTISDTQYDASTFAGYFVNFSTTRRSDFKLDYLLIKQHVDIVEFPDAPAITGMSIIDSYSIEVHFDRSLDTESAETPSNYILDQGYGHPLSASLNNGNVVTLVFNLPFSDGEYELLIQDLASTEGGIIEDTATVTFTYESPVILPGKLLPDDSSEAVFYDDFSDGTLASWSGTDNVYLAMERLKVADSATSPTIVTVDNERLRNTVWEVGIDIEGPVTTGNFIRLYLAANEHPSGAHQGYHLQIDGSGGNHVYRIYRQNGGTRSQIFQSAPIANVGGKFRARVRVICDIDGTWSVFADEYDSGTFTQIVRANGELTASDTQYEASTYAGYFVNFSTTRRNDFKLDYLLIKPLVADSATDEPEIQILSAAFLDSQHIQLEFNVPLDGHFLADMENFIVEPLGISPASIAVSGNMLTLTFDSPFPAGEYELVLLHLVMEADSPTVDELRIALVYQGAYEVRPFDVVINEIMARPNGSPGLPIQEYIELYNNTSHSISLSGWRYHSLTTSHTFTEGVIPGGGYLILCRVADVPLYQPYGSVLGISPWPVLVDGGTTITLRDTEDHIIDQVAYQSAWYSDAAKRSGGWSLERISVSEYCLGADNWDGSHDLRGGTPGTVNSIHHGTFNPEMELLDVEIVGAVEMRLAFSKDIDVEKALVLNQYHLNNGVGTPAEVEVINHRQLVIRFSTLIPAGQSYILTVDGISDCIGETTAHEYSFFLPDEIALGDIIINEILFNPKEGGVDFVEIYNYSNKTLDLRDLLIANMNSNGEVAAQRTIAEEQLLFHPGEYCVLTTNPDIVIAHYPNGIYHTFIGMGSLPAYPNVLGNVVLVNKKGEIIDHLRYHQSMHSDFIVDPKGVSLERSTFGTPTNTPGNFRSAATSVGGATPGYLNSQAEVFAHGEAIFLTSKTFSPDYDGFEDDLEINYRFTEPGLMANVEIYNDKGLLVKRLIRNQSLGTEGKVLWDGTTDSNQRLPVGIYVALIEVYNSAGYRKVYRESFVLAMKF